MRIDNSIRSQIQSTAESAASSSASAEETSKETSASGQNTDTIEKADPNSYSAIRHEIAGALDVADNDPAVDSTIASLVVSQRETQEAGRAEANNAIIDDALTNGRRIETTVQIDDNVGKTFEEIVPSSSGDLNDAVVRTGSEYTEHSFFFGDKTTRDTLYHDAAGKQLGFVESVIQDGVEKITKVIEYVPGAIALKPGDTRNVPDPTSGLAGKRPSTWDPQPDGRYGTTTGAKTSSSSSDTPSSSEPSYGQDTGIDRGGAPASNDGSSEPSGDGTASDPNEWAAWPGSSSDSSGSGLYVNAIDARDDGSVLITTSDGQSHEFQNFDDAAAWTKENTQAPPSNSSGSSGESGDTNTSVEGNTTVEVEEPDSGKDTGGDAGARGDTGTGTGTGGEEGGTKINEGEDDKYYAWGEGGSLDFGTLPQSSGGSEIDSSTSVSSSGSDHPTTESSGSLVGNPNNVVRDISYFDFGWKMDNMGGVTDGSRPDMEDSSMREQPYQGPGFGVIDTTPEVDDYSTAVRDPNDNLNFGGRGGDPVNPDNPIDNSRPDGGPPSTDPQSHNE